MVSKLTKSIREKISGKTEKTMLRGQLRTVKKERKKERKKEINETSIYTTETRT